MEFQSLKYLEVHLQSLIEAKLWTKVLVALALGLLVGGLLSVNLGIVDPALSATIGSWIALPGKLFLKLVQMIMLPLIFASIITGLVSTTGKQLKKLGFGVALYFIATTAVSIIIGILLSVAIKPGAFLVGSIDMGEMPIPAAEKNGQVFQNLPNAIAELLPGNPLASMVSGEMLAIVIFTIIIGIAITELKPEQKQPVVKLLGAIQEICMTIVKWAMRIIPFAVFGLIAQLVSKLGLTSLKGIGVYCLTVLAGLLGLLVIYLLLAWVVGRISPLVFLRKIREVQLLAFSTTSSAAVMPLTIKTAEEELNLSKSISNFLIPIGTTINMDGTAIFQCISTFFIAQAYGLDMPISSIVLIMFTIVAASIGTPSIPGGGVVILASVLQSAGIPAEGIVLIIGVERILGMFRTAINVTGDLTACIVFDWYEKYLSNQLTPAGDN